MKSKPDKTRRTSKKRAIKTNQVIAGIAQGKTTQEIAQDLGVTRQTVSEILNSKEAEDIIASAKDRTTRMIHDVLNRFEMVMKDPMDNSNAVKVGLAILKSHGIIKDQVDVNHNLPMPFIIRKHDGSESIEIGVGRSEKKGNEEG